MYQKTKVLKAKKAPKKPAERKPLTDEQRTEQRAKASCCILVEFYNPITMGDGTTTLNMKKWSNEWQQPHKGDLNDWVNELMRIFDMYWKGKAKSAAIFDTRFQKVCIGSERHPDCNKLYQFENRVWRAVK